MKKSIFILVAMAIVAMIAFNEPLVASCRIIKSTKTSVAPTKQKDSIQLQKDSLAVLLQKAVSGDAVAQNDLGCLCYEGKIVTQDYEAALKWWAQSAKQNNPDAIGNMAVCYQWGLGTKKDSVTAMKLYKIAIQKGNNKIIPVHEKAADGSAPNMFSVQLLADCYKQGLGVKRDIDKSIKYLKILANSGDVNHEFNYALACLNNNQPNLAFPWFKQVAKTGKKEAVFYYGYLLFNGMGTQRDAQQGLKLMEQAAAQDMPSAQYQVGKAYYEGNGVGKDLIKAKQYLREAVGKSKQAAWPLANVYLESDTADFFHAAQWIAEVYKGHKKDIQTLLSDKANANFRDYLIGLKKYCVEKDYDGALAIFKTVAKNGNVEGLTMQAVCLTDANYAKRNAKKAVKLLAKAIEKGSHYAEYHASLMYESGEGMKSPDKDRALALLSHAAQQGDIAIAQCTLGDKYFDGTGVNTDMTRAAALYLLAEGQYQLPPSSAKKLAECYKKKVQSLPDLDNAEKRIQYLTKMRDNTKFMDMLRTLSEK